MTSGQAGQEIIVTVSSITTYQKTVSGAASDLQVGQALMVTGIPDASPDIIMADTITIRPVEASNTKR